jgi:hypothetical protein
LPGSSFFAIRPSGLLGYFSSIPSTSANIKKSGNQLCRKTFALRQVGTGMQNTFTEM